MKLKALEAFIPSNQLEVNDLQIIKDFIENNPNALTRDNEIGHLTVSAWVLNLSLDKVLMAHHNIYNSWSWLGGHVDGNEDLCQVAINEVKEEAGIEELKLFSSECISVDILPVQAHQKNGKLIASHQHFNITYAFVVDDKQMIRPKLDENKAVKWIDVDEIEKFVIEKKMLPIYEKIMNRVLNKANKD